MRDVLVIEEVGVVSPRILPVRIAHSDNMTIHLQSEILRQSIKGKAEARIIARRSVSPTVDEAGNITHPTAGTLASIYIPMKDGRGV